MNPPPLSPDHKSYYSLSTSSKALLSYSQQSLYVVTSLLEWNGHELHLPPLPSEAGLPM